MGWLDKKELFNKKFEKFVNEQEIKKNEDSQQSKYPRWTIKKKDRGTFEIRFLPDKNLKPYKEYQCHIWEKDDGSFVFVPCMKTHGADVFCPWCKVSYTLFRSSSKRDKEEAKKYFKKDKTIANILVIDDPRDSDKGEDERNAGNVFIYDYPPSIQNKVKNEIEDKKNGLGSAIINPEEGYNFILKVESKGEWPNYENSMFARKLTAIAPTDEEIDAIMDKVYDLDEVVADFEAGFTPQKHIELLKEEMQLDNSALRADIKKHWDIDIDMGEDDPNLDDLNETKSEPQKEEKSEAVKSMDKLPWDNAEDNNDFSANDEDILADLEDLIND